MAWTLLWVVRLVFYNIPILTVPLSFRSLIGHHQFWLLGVFPVHDDVNHNQVCLFRNYPDHMICCLHSHVTVTCSLQERSGFVQDLSCESCHP